MLLHVSEVHSFHYTGAHDHLFMVYYFWLLISSQHTWILGCSAPDFPGTRLLDMIILSSSVCLCEHFVSLWATLHFHTYWAIHLVNLLLPLAHAQGYCPGHTVIYLITYNQRKSARHLAGVWTLCFALLIGREARDQTLTLPPFPFVRGSHPLLWWMDK